MMEFANPAALWFLTLILPIVLLYLLKRRRQDHVVPSIFLWKQALEDSQAYTPFQKLRSNLLLLLQILAIVLLTALLAQPYFPAASKQTQQWILVLDGSASMQATDEKPNRFDAARNKLSALLKSMSPADEAMLVSVASEASILQNFTSDHDSVRNKLNRLQAEDVAAEWEQLLLLLKPFLKKSPRPKIVVASDFADFPTDKMQILDFDTAAVGRPASNIGITRATVEPLPDSLQDQLLFFQLKNFSSVSQSAEVRIEQNDQLLDAFDIPLGPGEQSEKTLRVAVSAPARFEILLQPDDSFLLDNDFTLMTGPRVSIPVLLALDNPFLRRAIEVLPGIEISQKAEILISDRLTDSPGLYLLPGDISGPAAIIQWDAAADAMRYVDAGLWEIWNYRLLDVPGSTHGLLETSRGTVGYSLDQGDTRQIVLGFQIANSNLPTLAGFPIFVGNALEWIHRGLHPVKPSMTNRTFPREGEIDSGQGYVNFANEKESTLSPRKVSGQSIADTKTAILRQDFSMWFLMALIGVVILEWWVFHRKQTV